MPKEFIGINIIYFLRVLSFKQLAIDIFDYLKNALLEIELIFFVEESTLTGETLQNPMHVDLALLIKLQSASQNSLFLKICYRGLRFVNMS